MKIKLLHVPLSVVLLLAAHSAKASPILDVGHKFAFVVIQKGDEDECDPCDPEVEDCDGPSE